MGRMGNFVFTRIAPRQQDYARLYSLNAYLIVFQDGRSIFGVIFFRDNVSISQVTRLLPNYLIKHADDRVVYNAELSL